MGQQDAVRAELDVGDPVGVLFYLEHQLAVGGRVDADHFLRSPERDLSVVGADVGSQDDVGLGPDFENASAGLDVEDNDSSRLTAASSTFLSPKRDANLSAMPTRFWKTV